MTFRMGAMLPRWGFEMATNVFDLRRFRSDDGAGTSGTGFGSGGAMLQPTPRQRERRQAFADLLAGLTRAMDRRNDVSLMRGAFEDLMRRAVPVRTSQLREAGSRWIGRPEVCGAESFAVEVPGADPVNAGVLEATFDPSSGLGEWDFQMLAMAAHLGALVLEIERSRLQLARAGLWAPTRVRRDGAAPLIGSTPIMSALRGSIERVSSTDFAVLLEGESGVGKELVARQIHELSRRRNGPFVAINCAALVETLLGRVVRHRGSHGHRCPRTARQVRGGRRRHPVSGRSI